MNDSAQRERALDITQSFIVQAPAGSGKTELLTQRYLKLLTVCEQPENVMAMTFTNKAVDELTERVLSALKSTQNPRPTLPHKQITYDLAMQVIARSDKQDWQLLQNPKRLKIATIDGLSSLISNQNPLDSQLVPYQIMAKKWQQDVAYKHAAEQTLLMIDDAQFGAPIADLLLYLDNHVERFYRLIISMLGKRDQWLTRLYLGDSLNPEVLRNSARKIVEQHLQRLHGLATQHLTPEFFALLQGNTLPIYAQIQGVPNPTIQDLTLWQNLADLMLKGGKEKKNEWRGSVNKNNGFAAEAKDKKTEFIDFLFALEGKGEFKDALFELFSLPDADFSKTQADTLVMIAKVLKICAAQLNVYFEQQQAHDFIQVALNANQALDARQGVSEVALFLDYQLQHLLIDEFQDTNASQFNTLEKLIDQWQIDDGKTLFLVGDPMQSIYRFRESQVGLFLQVKSLGIANISPTPLLLSTNFRSSQSIVEANNEFFQRIFPEHEDIYQGAIAYSPSQSACDFVNEAAVNFYPFAHDQFEQEAQVVLKLVHEALVANTESDVAILVRNRSHLQNITELLKQNDIAFEGVKTTALKDHLLIRDLFSLTKALLHLGDKLAWLSVLRAPWCGLILDDLLVLSAGDECIIYQQLSDAQVLEKLSKDGRLRAQHLRDCLQDVLDNQGRFDFVELLTYALQQLGVTASLSPLESMIKDQFLHVIHECESQQLLNITAIESALAELYAPSDNARVKLMTIHQSKGLEFDTVILPGLGRTPAHDNPPIMHIKAFADESLLLAPIKSSLESDESRTYQYLKFVDSQQSKFETMRLLYVAMTRAKHNLHLLGAVSASGKVNANSLLALLITFYQARFDQLPKPDVEASIEIQAPKLQRFKQLVTPLSKPQTRGETIEYQTSFERLFKSLLGTLLHQYYEHGLFTPSVANISARLIEIGTPSAEIDKYQDFIVTLLNNTKNDAQFNWLFKQRTSTLTEAEFIADGTAIAIDRLFIDASILWIIDFKTAELAQGESLEQFITRQRTQHAKQLLFYKEVLSEVYDNEIKCALYCPAVSQLIEM